MNDCLNEGEILGDMDPEEFRRYGHELIDLIADYRASIRERPSYSAMSAGTIVSKLPVSPSRKGETMARILEDFKNIFLVNSSHWNHPGFMAYFASSSSGPGLLGELLSSALNLNTMMWQAAPAASELEGIALSWLRQMMGLPETFFGCAFEGGSLSTLHALAAARDNCDEHQLQKYGLAARKEVPAFRIYTSEFGHSSIDKAAATLGLGFESVRRINADGSFRMDPAHLETAIRDDRSCGVFPLAVVATIGTTSCTSIDPISDIAAICLRENIWLHIDAAHGGASVLLPEMDGEFLGWERADSIVINPHKWLFVPLDMSILYTRRPDALKRSFSLTPEYLRAEGGNESINFMDYGLPLGRRFRGLKLWFVIRYFGVDGLANRISKHRRLAKEFAGWIDSDSNFEVMAPVPLSTVCFRARPQCLHDEERLNILNRALLLSTNLSGKNFISHTQLRDRFCLRASIGHIETSIDDLKELWETLTRSLSRLLPDYVRFKDGHE